MTNTNKYYDEYADRKYEKYEPSDRMPKLYQKVNPRNATVSEVEKRWLYQLPEENKSFDYITSLDKETRSDMFFVTAVSSRTGEGSYIKVVRLNDLGLDSAIDYIRDPKTIILIAKEDD